VLVVDDDPEMVELVRLVFERDGAQVYSAGDGREGICQYGACRPDLILLDVMMPEMDGWETCRLLREFADAPIIFLSVLNNEHDVVRGLDCGAVDYVSKPFDPEVLLARARAALRAGGAGTQRHRGVLFGDGHLSIDLDARRVLVDGEPVRLTSTEYRLLSYPLQNAGRVLTHEQILGHVWGGECHDSIEYVHVYVWHLRKKLEQDPHDPRYLLTEHGVGYRFERGNWVPREQAA